MSNAFINGFRRASLFLVTVSLAACAAQDTTAVALPGPQLDRGRPLMQVLANRKSSREFSTQDLSMQDLSNLLWAGFGINRPENNGRTAPSARNTQEIDLYVATAKAVYKYNAKENALQTIAAKDIRELTGSQPFVKDAPAEIILVADLSRVKKGPVDQRKAWASADAAFISENMYLYCASEGLATVVRASVDRTALSKALNLGVDQEIIFAQTVGYPKQK